MAYVRVKIDSGPFIASIYVDDAKLDDSHKAVSEVPFDKLVRQEIGDRKPTGLNGEVPQNCI